MSFFVVDIEADGPIPGDYSMISLGAVLIDEQKRLTTTFYGKLKPISENWVPDALAVSGFTREETLKFEDPKQVMTRFSFWVQKHSKGRAVFLSDNNGFDWMFSCWYFHHFTGSNPFGFSSRRIGDIYCGVELDLYAKWKHLRKTKHDHNPVNDAIGNAEAFISIENRIKELRADEKANW